MTTLTTFVTYYKKTIFFLAAFLIIAVALMAFSNLLGAIIDSLTGANKIPPTVAFGKLPKLDLSEGVKPANNTTYKIETITGDLPNLDMSAKVFSIKKQVATFSDLEDSKIKAKALEFPDTPIENINGKVKFKSKDDESKNLTVEVITQSFRLESDYLGNPDIISGRVHSEESAINSVINFFQVIQTSPNQFPQENVFIENYDIEQGQLVESTSPSSTNLIKVILNYSDIDGLPVLSINSQSPFVWALTTGREIVAAEYNNFEVEKHKFSTYPLKDIKQAFEELKNGNGVLNKNQKDNVFTLRKVKLGYLETRVSQDFLQPVYVFESDEGSAAFVSAVSSAWINNN